MQTITISATKARQDFFNLITWISNGNKAIIKKDEQELVVMSPRKTAMDWVGLKKVMDSSHGIAPDFDINNSPLRGQRSKKWLKKIRNQKF